jgi:hypothetical protein
MPKVNRLIAIATNNEELYKQFLSRISAGCSLASTCASLGLRPDTASKLLGKAETTKDAAYRKVARDIRGAIGKAMMVSEAEIRKLDPKFWLKQGPGRILTNEWSDESNNASNNNINTASNISSDDIISALIQLRQCGISIDNLIESGEIKSLRIDAGAKPNINIISNQPPRPVDAADIYGESSCTFSTSGNNETISPSPDNSLSTNSNNPPVLVNKTNGQSYDGSLAKGKVVREVPKIKDSSNKVPVEKVVPRPNDPPVVDEPPPPKHESTYLLSRHEFDEKEKVNNAKNAVVMNDLDVLPDGLKKFLDSKDK